MKRYVFTMLFLMAMTSFTQVLAAPAKEARFPWDNGKLQVSKNQRYLVHENGIPFFWLGDTGWLASSRLSRENMDYYFSGCQKNGFNVVQVSVLHDLPFFNVYGKMALPHGFNFDNMEVEGEYGYWDHVDYMVDAAAKRGIYIGIVCVWNGPVNSGKLTVADAVKYGTFLANRYKDKPNIIWLIGGDTKGDVHQDVWLALARTIRSIDSNHLMTFHPLGRRSSSEWFNNETWLDFNMFQSGHRRYNQRNGDGDYAIEENTEEDNWRFVERAYKLTPKKPILDGEPSYEQIPQGLHDVNERLWQAEDVRRYAYWSVFAGSFGHTYGHNSIMQMLSPGISPAYGATKYWYNAQTDPGYCQMHYLKNLMTALPFTEGEPDQTLIVGDAGQKHDRLIATRGKDYALVYTYTGKEIKIDLTKISGKTKNIWWYDPANGSLLFVESVGSAIKSYIPEGGYRGGNDKVLIAIDSEKEYLQKDWKTIPSKQ
jgi:hypothetical protein